MGSFMPPRPGMMGPGSSPMMGGLPPTPPSPLSPPPQPPRVSELPNSGNASPKVPAIPRLLFEVEQGMRLLAKALPESASSINSLLLELRKVVLERTSQGANGKPLAKGSGVMSPASGPYR